MHFPVFFHQSVMVPVSIVGCLFEGRKSAVIIRTLVAESNIFSDQCCELLCFVLRDFADPRHGWDHTCLSTGKREWREKAQEVTQMRHAHPLTRAVRHGSLHDPIKRSVAVSVSVHMKSCNIYYFFLEFYRSRVRIRIRINGISP